MGVTTKDNLNRMKLVGLETTTGPMVKLTKEIGQKIKWTGKVHYHGKTVKDTRETL